MVFFDAPWSWGNYAQLLGRPVRIGSVHKTVVVYHLIARRPAKKLKDQKTIDDYTLDLLRAKKDLVDKTFGASAQGALEFDKATDGPKELLRMMQEGTTSSPPPQTSKKKEVAPQPKRIADDFTDEDAINAAFGK